MIHTVHLFPTLDAHLIDLLQSLSPDDWHRQTVARRWQVKDVAAHLLDGNIRMLSQSRDGHSTPPDRAINNYQDLVGYLNALNADFVRAARRISPALLTELLEITGKAYSAHVATLDMHVPAPFAVAWAGEDTSVNWFHIAREYTERWHHQQQIRDAVGKPGILTPDLFFPCIDTLLLGLPHTYRHIDAPFGTEIEVSIALENGKKLIRYLIRENDKWTISAGTNAAVAALLDIPADTAWKLFTKALTPEEALKSVRMRGDQKLASAALQMVAVMA